MMELLFSAFYDMRDVQELACDRLRLLLALLSRVLLLQGQQRVETLYSTRQKLQCQQDMTHVSFLGAFAQKERLRLIWKGLPGSCYSRYRHGKVMANRASTK